MSESESGSGFTEFTEWIRIEQNFKNLQNFQDWRINGRQGNARFQSKKVMVHIVTAALKQRGANFSD